MYEIHNIFYFSNEMIYYFSFGISGWNSLRKQRSLLGARSPRSTQSSLLGSKHPWAERIEERGLFSQAIV